MKVKIGRQVLDGRFYFASTHGMWLIRFGSVLIAPAYLPRLGGAIVEVTTMECADLVAQRCPINAIAPALRLAAAGPHSAGGYN